MLTLPDGYTFVRPDPYHAALCRRQEETGVALAPAECDLLFTQHVRETAEVCLAQARPLELIGPCGQLLSLIHI